MSNNYVLFVNVKSTQIRSQTLHMTSFDQRLTIPMFWVLVRMHMQHQVKKNEQKNLYNTKSWH